MNSPDALTTGDIIVRIQVLPEPLVVLTFDAPDDAGQRTWYTQPAGLKLTGTATPDEFVPVLMSGGMAVAHALLPSLLVDQLQVRLDESSDPTEVVGFGSVQFLQSEWDAVKHP